MSKPKTATYTWTHQPVFTKEMVKAITAKASLWQRFKLLFVASRYSFDDDAVIRYKRMGGIVYVMKRGTKL
jgi:hypothetical protein